MEESAGHHLPAAYGGAGEISAERLLAALRMPYLRATLTGAIPNTGDCGIAQSAHANFLADYLVAGFPKDTWLAQIGTGSTLSAKLLRYRSGQTVDPNAWRALLDPQPHLFPDAGMAILRSGATPETQIMATLDYGRNIMHAALDRNQLTLSAFGGSSLMDRAACITPAPAPTPRWMSGCMRSARKHRWGRMWCWWICSISRLPLASCWHGTPARRCRSR